jgi:fatty-acid desaturase
MNWPTVIVFGIFHILALVAIPMFSWKVFLVAVGIHWACISLGIGMGYHRLHTHRAYKVPEWMDYMFAVLGTMTLEGGPIFWVATHRIHHQLSDKPGDPHSPHDGAWWAHIGWMLFGEAKHSNTKLMAKYCTGSGEGQLLQVARRLPHRAADHSLCDPLSRRRSADADVGRVRPRDLGSALHLAGELRHPHVGHAPLPDPR